MSRSQPPTTGERTGAHRVLEPTGVRPVQATRLDALSDLWDAELRVDLEALVVSQTALDRWRARIGSAPTVLAAALLEMVAERGGVDGELGAGTYVGRVAAVGRAHPWPAQPGERVAVPLPAAALPAFAQVASWDGRRRAIAVRGHVIVPAACPTVLADGSPEQAASAALLADLPAALRAGPPPRRVLVIGPTTAEGAVAVATLAAQAEVVGLTDGLPGVRTVQGLGATQAVVGDPTEAAATADLLTTETAGAPDLVVLADPRGAALAATVATVSRVLVLCDPAVVPELLRCARAAGSDVAITLRRMPPVDRGTALSDLVASNPTLARLLAATAETHPSAGDTGPDPERP